MMLKNSQNGFPYYIVRFKPDFSQRWKEIAAEFPYYIVRFKLVGVITGAAKNMSFHTT